MPHSLVPVQRRRDGAVDAVVPGTMVVLACVGAPYGLVLGCSSSDLLVLRWWRASGTGHSSGAGWCIPGTPMHAPLWQQGFSSSSSHTHTHTHTHTAHAKRDACMQAKGGHLNSNLYNRQPHITRQPRRPSRHMVSTGDREKSLYGNSPPNGRRAA